MHLFVTRVISYTISGEARRNGGTLLSKGGLKKKIIYINKLEKFDVLAFGISREE